jgi:hypothetical protein
VANIPPILKHTTLAIYSGGSIKNCGIRERFRRSFDIAVSQLKKYGYITGGGTDFQVTQKGLARKHEAEGMKGRAFKAVKFDAMFMVLIRERSLKSRREIPQDKPETLGVNVLGNQGFPKEAPHSAEPLYAHSRKPKMK